MPRTWSVRAITRATLPILLALTVVEVGSGLVLGTFEATLLQYPSLLVLVPVTIGTAGNLGSILASRLSTAFHLGTLSFDPGDDDLAGNVVATVMLAITVFPVVGAGAWGVAAATGSVRLPVGVVIAVAAVAGASLAVLAVAVTLLATYAAYRFELDPDDVVIPVVTNTCDVLGVVVLFGAVEVLV
ncbi:MULTISPECIES: magnesium transporter [Halobacterium]|uniref:MgtE family transport protein n=4 Tax=Halobacterium salinarum TaxID=2242 RepID=A0A510N990_HALSA|nr:MULTISPECIES: magnesium transporter [Halobacterium]MBB6089535.1 mgtE-like transporter [Halobacterium salinarum]MCF2164285.1 magnesium transporter [Halobacterium salinarum]MCF2167072.1 magnesium transporter [Halobacterium salinarum]MCF2207268.1 magnesium transporter [Halobacterium salinarum]MCF2239126.1 magnesium transporter [Halobacterium salinarum]